MILWYKFVGFEVTKFLTTFLTSYVFYLCLVVQNEKESLGLLRYNLHVPTPLKKPTTNSNKRRQTTTMADDLVEVLVDSGSKITLNRHSKYQ